MPGPSARRSTMATLRLLTFFLSATGLLFFSACGGGGGGGGTTGVQPPVLTYSAMTAVYTVGVAISPNTPANSGGAATSYTVQPALPAGLSISAATGVISGTPTAAAAQATYTVTASNSGGSGHAAVSITVNDVAPSGLSYSVNPATYSVGAAISPNVPSWSNAGGTPTSFSGSVPSGLSLDPSTGIISGTPAAAAAQAIYQITASNSGGSANANLTITVIPQAPYVVIQPASQTVASGISTYLSVGAGGGGILSYQWYQNSTPIANSNNNIYTTPVLTSANNGDQFYVVVSDNYNRTATSNVATLTVKGVSGTFVNTGTPTVARSIDAATLLQNGMVLITGGRNGNTILVSAELYDPATGNFTATDSFSAPRTGYTATLLQNGKVLIVGGSGGPGTPTTGSAELYDPSTGTFSATGFLGIGRAGHSATLLANGNVLIAGGASSSDGFTFTLVGVAELYDPVAGTFSSTGSLSQPRTAPAVLLTNGQVLIAGGFGGAGLGNGGALASAEIYDPIAGMFSSTGSLITPRLSHSLTLLQNGKVLVAGGDNTGAATLLASAELYDPLTGTFAATGSLNFQRDSQSATLLQNGQVLVVGGSVGGFVPTPAMQMSEIYDPASGVFILNAPTNSARFFLSATLLSNGQVLIEGQETSAISVTPPVPAELYQP